MKTLAAILALTCLAGCDSQAEARLATPVEVDGDMIPAALRGLQGNAGRGETVFTEREQGHCVLCHAVEGLDAEFQGNVGPDLSTVGKRLSREQLRLRIADAQYLWPGTLMPSYYRTEGLNQVATDYQGQPALSAQQIEDLVSYLAQLDGDAT